MLRELMVGINSQDGIEPIPGSSQPERVSASRGFSDARATDQHPILAYGLVPSYRAAVARPERTTGRVHESDPESSRTLQGAFARRP